MKRMLLAAMVIFAPFMLMSTSGCEKEVRTVDHKQTVQQSEPKMVSPGKEVIE